MIHPFLARRALPSIDLILSQDAVAANATLAWLATDTTSTTPLTDEQRVRLDLPTLHDFDEDGLLITARIDASGVTDDGRPATSDNSKWTSKFAAVQRGYVDESLKCRRSWSRSTSSKQGGIGVGAGIRIPQNNNDVGCVRK